MPSIDPNVRAVADRRGVNLDDVTGTGPDGALTVPDVWRAAGGGRIKSSNEEYAEQMGVDYAALNGTGKGGRVTLADIDGAARRQRAASAPRPSAADTATTRPAVAHPAWASNPLIAAAAQRDPKRYRAAAASTNPMPTMFATGNLPPFTASGIDPKVLLQVPWQARFALAAAPTTAAAYALVQRFGAATPEEAAVAADDAAVEYGTSGPVVDYQRRVDAWLAGSMSSDQVMGSLFGGQR